ncbi:MAG TPA: GNAT family N-acetyltransferase [Thermoleophilaceae bacterium]
MSDVRVWRASPGEAADVTRLMVAFRNWWKRDWPDDEAFARGVERLLADENTDYLLGAVGDGAPSGVCQLRFRFSLWWDAPDCLLEDLYVEDAARGHGLGEALVNAAVARARGRGCRRVELDTNETNAPAIALYERLGFSSYVDDAGGHNRFMRLHL